MVKSIKNALSTERQPTPEELVTTIAASCHYDIMTLPKNSA